MHSGTTAHLWMVYAGHQSLEWNKIREGNNESESETSADEPLKKKLMELQAW